MVGHTHHPLVLRGCALSCMFVERSLTLSVCRWREFHNTFLRRPTFIFYRLVGRTARAGKSIMRVRQKLVPHVTVMIETSMAYGATCQRRLDDTHADMQRRYPAVSR